MDFDGVMLSEIKSDKGILNDLIYIWNLKKAEVIETENRMVVDRGGGNEMLVKGTNFRL